MDHSAKVSKNMESFLSTFTERMSKYEIDLKSAKASANTPDIAALAKDFSEFKSFVLSCFDMLKSQLDFLSRGLDKHEMGTRRKVLLIHGVPEATEEDPGDTIRSILQQKIDASSECLSDIRVTHRLGAKGTKTRPILVRFSTLKARQEVWELKKKLKGTGITASEFLTKPRHDVFIAARKHFGMENVWSTDGRIVLLLPDKKRVKVECMSELSPYTAKFASKETPSSADKGKQPATGAATNTGKSVSKRRQAAANK